MPNDETKQSSQWIAHPQHEIEFHDPIPFYSQKISGFHVGKVSFNDWIDENCTVVKSNWLLGSRLPIDEADDESVFSRLFAFTKELRDRIVIDETVPVNAVSGVMTSLGGLRRYTLQDDQGVVERFEVPREDIQTLLCHAEQIGAPEVKFADATASMAAVANLRASALDRLYALRHLVMYDNDSAAAYVVEHLNSNDDTIEWRRMLVSACDTVVFPPVLRERALAELLQSATSMREVNEDWAREAVWTCLHRAGSLASPESAFNFLEFLSLRSLVDTRLATLQALGRIFETMPQNDENTFAAIADRSAAMASKLWDPDVFAAGVVSSIATEATYLAAILGHSKTRELLNAASALKREWIVKKIRNRIYETLQTWSDHTESKTYVALNEIFPKLSCG